MDFMCHFNDESILFQVHPCAVGLVYSLLPILCISPKPHPPHTSSQAVYLECCIVSGMDQNSTLIIPLVQWFTKVKLNWKSLLTVAVLWWGMSRSSALQSTFSYLWKNDVWLGNKTITKWRWCGLCCPILDSLDPLFAKVYLGLGSHHWDSSVGGGWR